MRAAPQENLGDRPLTLDGEQLFPPPEAPDRRHFLRSSMRQVVGISLALGGLGAGEASAQENTKGHQPQSNHPEKPPVADASRGSETSTIAVAVSEAAATNWGTLTMFRHVFNSQKDRDNEALQERVRIALESGPVEHDPNYSLTDVEHRLGNGAVWRNLGVRHTPEDLILHAAHLKAAIKGADIVLVEAPSVHSPTTSYFGRLADWAACQWKKVVSIDDNLREPKVTLLLALQSILGLSSIISAHQRVFEYDKAQDGLLGRFSWGRASGWLNLLFAFPSIPFFLKKKEDDYPKLDVSYVADGRTVKMYKHILEIAAKNPGQKILVLTGDFHAIGFEHYAEHPRSFSIRSKLYDWTYFLFGGKREESR